MIILKMHQSHFFTIISFAAKQALTAIKNYGFSGAEKIILLLHEYNLKGIGINSAISGSAADAELLKRTGCKNYFAYKNLHVNHAE